VGDVIDLANRQKKSRAKKDATLMKELSDEVVDVMEFHFEKGLSNSAILANLIRLVTTNIKRSDCKDKEVVIKFFIQEAEKLKEQANPEADK
jgi:hypothetical protein